MFVRDFLCTLQEMHRRFGLQLLAILVCANVGCRSEAPAESTPTRRLELPAASAAPSSVWSEPVDAAAEDATTKSGTPTRKPAAAGEMCAGFAGIPCAAGLRCVTVGPRHPDQSGTCQPAP